VQGYRPDRFLKLATRSKHFIDTIKITIYRAETAMALVVREQLNAHHQDEARALIRDLCTTPADPTPDHQSKTLPRSGVPNKPPATNSWTIVGGFVAGGGGHVARFDRRRLMTIFRPVPTLEHIT